MDAYWTASVFQEVNRTSLMVVGCKCCNYSCAKKSFY